MKVVRKCMSKPNFQSQNSCPTLHERKHLCSFTSFKSK
eukprot:UN14512